MKRLVEWNCKEKNSALPVAINDFGDTYSTEEICAQLAVLYDIIGDCDLDRLQELIQADREEKCLILPCKVGDTVYKFDASICKYRDKDKCDEYCDGFQYRDCWEGSQIVAATNFELKMLWSFGKTVFPTREEAEAALAKRKEN